MHLFNLSPEEREAALYAITSSPDVMAGEPVFRGTRVPIDIVLGSLEAGIEFARLHASYPFLTEALVNAAKVYTHIHPRRSQPCRLQDCHPDLVSVRTTVVRSATSPTDAEDNR